MPTDPEILKACLPLPSCPPPPVLVRSRVTVEARPTPSGKPRHARSPDRLPVNFRWVSQRLRTACSASHAWVLSVNVPPDCTRRRADRSYSSRWRDSIRASRTGPAARGSVLRAHAGRTGRRMAWCAPEYLGDPDLRRFLL